jgi:hypothetical protein
MSERAARSSQSVALIAGRYELLRESAGNADTVRWEAFDSALERRVLLDFPRHDLVGDPAAVERFWEQARVSARTSTVAGARVLDAGTDPETGRAFVVREWPQGPTEDETHALRVPEAVRPATPRRVRPTAPRLTPISRRLVVTAGVVALGLAMLLVLRAGAQSWLDWVNAPLVQISNQFVLGPLPTASAASAQPAVAGTAAPAPATAPAATRAAVAATPTPAATPRATATPVETAGVARRIVNTDGRGVALRASPGGDRLPGKGYDEGVTVTAFERNGDWTRIRGADGREGWVLTVTLS